MEKSGWVRTERLGARRGKELKLPSCARSQASAGFKGYSETGEGPAVLSKHPMTAGKTSTRVLCVALVTHVHKRFNKLEQVQRRHTMIREWRPCVMMDD